MKILAVLVAMITCQSLYAYPCPHSLDTDQKSQRMLEWISRVQGRVALENCQVEITVCDPKEGRQDGAPLGEIVVLDLTHPDAYMTFTVAESNDQKFETQMRFGEKRLKYIKFDRYYEEEFGRTEAFRFEIKIEDDGRTIKNLDLGTYSTNKKLHHKNGNQSRWYKCGGQMLSM